MRAGVDALLDKAWNGEQISLTNYTACSHLIKEPLGRRIWVSCMNHRRAEGRFVLADGGFELVGEFMNALLNEVQPT